ncbi:MAG: sulfatase-like hydrolase/transferase, partial [Bacteroidetes bacterium]|nr:sulfatase-like hydrolase/transferase [Bacteroidota bacterium]
MLRVFRAILIFLQQVYPPLLVSLVLFPILLSYLINADLADSRNILIQLVWLPFFTLSYLLFQKKWIYRLAACFYFITGSLEIIHWSLLKGPISVLSLIALVNTNPSESSESLEILLVKEPYGLLALLPFVALFVYNLWKIQKPKKENISKLALLTIALFSLAFIGENLYKNRLIRKGIPPVVSTLASFLTEMKTYEEAMQSTAARKVNISFDLSLNQQTVVLIIGESCNRNHMSLYAYHRNTNPLLTQRQDLLCFSNVVSGYSNTISSVLAMLSNSNV